MIQERVSIGRLKARLSEYLRRATAGQEVVVTDRGRPVARLIGLEGQLDLEGRVLELVDSGKANGPQHSLDLGLLQRLRPADPDGRSLEAVLEERAESR
jgi:prevent-host-death family protein